MTRECLIMADGALQNWRMVEPVPNAFRYSGTVWDLYRRSLAQFLNHSELRWSMWQSHQSRTRAAIIQGGMYVSEVQELQEAGCWPEFGDFFGSCPLTQTFCRHGHHVSTWIPPESLIWVQDGEMVALWVSKSSVLTAGQVGDEKMRWLKMLGLPKPRMEAASLPELLIFMFPYLVDRGSDCRPWPALGDGASSSVRHYAEQQSNERVRSVAARSIGLHAQSITIKVIIPMREDRQRRTQLKLESNGAVAGVWPHGMPLNPM